MTATSTSPFDHVPSAAAAFSTAVRHHTDLAVQLLVELTSAGFEISRSMPSHGDRNLATSTP